MGSCHGGTSSAFPFGTGVILGYPPPSRLWEVLTVRLGTTLRCHRKAANVPRIAYYTAVCSLTTPRTTRRTCNVCHRHCVVTDKYPENTQRSWCHSAPRRFQYPRRHSFLWTSASWPVRRMHSRRGQGSRPGLISPLLNIMEADAPSLCVDLPAYRRRLDHSHESRGRGPQTSSTPTTDHATSRPSAKISTVSLMYVR